MLNNPIFKRKIFTLSVENMTRHLSKNVLIKTPLFSFSSSKHNLQRKGHHHDKTYRRIWPAAKHLMVKHNISEEDLNPNIKVIMKEHILEHIEKQKQGVLPTSYKNVDQKVAKPEATPVNVNLFNDGATISDNYINYAEFKGKLPHCYYYNSAEIENLNNHLQGINNTHKKSIKVEDFVAKVKL